MEHIFIVEGWTFKSAIPSRKGNYFTIERDGIEVVANVLCWLDKNLASTAKGQKGPYIFARRIRQGNELPMHFAIKVN